jgi:hypothetical protein
VYIFGLLQCVFFTACLVFAYHGNEIVPILGKLP